MTPDLPRRFVLAGTAPLVVPLTIAPLRGQSVDASCSLPVSAVGRAEITTTEGVSGPEAAAVRRAWIAHDVPQCGYCQSGQIISAIALLKAIRKPTDHDIDLAMAGNPCRCATYVRIRAAIHDAARVGRVR